MIAPLSRGIGRDLNTEVRAVLLLASAVVLYETIFFTVLIPLLPHYEPDLGLSKASGGSPDRTYAAGAFCGAIPGGIFALRRGTRRLPC